MENQEMQSKFVPANIGTVSHGTARPEDLIEAFTAELEHQMNRNAGWLYPQSEYRDELVDLIWSARKSIESDLQEYVNALIDMLSEFAPYYCYFGAHQDDGSDFGFWPDFDAIRDNDVPEFSDLSDIPDDYHGDCLVINDHGNATLYSVEFRDGKQTYRELWAIV